MSGERAKRFPLALEDLKRAPRKAEGRTGERHAAGESARQRVSAGAAAGANDNRQPRGGAKALAAAPDKPGASRSAGPTPVVPKPAAAAAAPSAPKHGTSKAAVHKPAVPKPAAAPNVALAGTFALTSERVRERMVERLRANGVTDARVLEAMAAVPRHMFVDPGLATQAYEDSALPIGHQQTISKPSVVARMIELAMAGRTLERVLEIGTGCGYQAAVLSHVARDVYSIERIKPLYERAKLNLRPLRVPNIRLHYGDGRVGLPSAAPFDAIVIAAAGLDVPQALLEQLTIGGRLVAPVGAQSGQHQVLTLVERVAHAQWRESRLDRVFFVPLKSGVI
ncbi:protein-L-isoaspartate(D-aspartate) O-methyltransferase [Burkholderia sp. Bp8963]|uniref:protein-L-isoaspartate(D-aspartate) O-methyltransferase n=1 Tax=Burkholderia sp. Bp8963 TaxID=2184547 RepID=UPI000F5B1823|nr:protein-L-isoaspartate(D-aspartate) O-methyltransferase [Burkholderia sp. Bp8963]RQS66136.1 protein-L-isoaspartate(D-aspartate) O-methyltransferase [Burkholderia sp. Bp8963]